MKYIWQFFQSIVVIAVLLLLISTIHVPGQIIEPDEQIKSEMIAFAKQAEENLSFSRPRFVQKNEVFDNAGLKQEVLFTEISNKETVNLNALYALEKQAFNILNQKRLANGLEPLKWNEDVARVARFHSQNMAQYKFFSHAGIDGTMVNNRADALGLNHWRSIGENIAFNLGFKKPVESACEQWMQSPAHKENILDKRWKETGIGIAVAQDGTFYFTQVFMLK